MADEAPKGSGPVGDLVFIASIIGILIVLWFANGAHSGADLRGIFLHPPQPVGPGGAYGPTLATSSATLEPVNYPEQTAQ
jgi:hypothetical protein